MQVLLDYNSLASYDLFLRIKALPTFKIRGRMAEFPDEYSDRLGLTVRREAAGAAYTPAPFLFDYQRAIAAIAIRKRKFAVFADPGLGKTLTMAEYARHVLSQLPPDRRVLIVNPCMVTEQTRAELARFYGGELTPTTIHADSLQQWLESSDKSSRFGITNFEALKKGIQPGRLGALLIDESSVLKSAYGTFGRRLIRLGRGLDWKLCLTGTPAPNDRIEYGSHAVLLDQFPNINSFLARYFVNRGQTDNRWELKPHALRPFYRDLSHWCIFLSNPATYGWKDNCGNIPPIHVHIHEVDMTPEQRDAVRRVTGKIVCTNPGGITKRSALSRIAKGSYRGKEIPTLKYEFIQDLIGGWRGEESTLVWAWFDDEQDRLEKTLPDAASLRGKTKVPRRLELIEEFKAGRRREMVSKPAILGFGLNLQVATRQVFSSLIDSYEKYFQCVKRSNRVGSTRPLNVHLPIVEVEQPMVSTVLRKAKRVEQDTREQEEMFKESSGWSGSW